MSSPCLLNSAMQPAQGFLGPRSSKIKNVETRTAVGCADGRLQIIHTKCLAVEQTTGHFGKIRAGETKVISLSRRWNVQFPQSLPDIHQTPDAPDSSNKHMRIPFQVHDALRVSPIRRLHHASRGRRAMLASHGGFTRLSHMPEY